MPNANAPLPAALDLLEGAYGPPPEPGATDPWDQVLLENVVYLAGDERRIEAFERLRARVGTAPSALLESPIGELGEATRLGIRADAQARKLQAAARLAVTHFGGDLGSRLAAMSLAEARRALRRFAAIGEPAADRILLQAGLHAVPALDSNGLRVLVRLGLARDAPSYAVSHRSATAVLRDTLPASGRRCCARTCSSGRTAASCAAGPPRPAPRVRWPIAARTQRKAVTASLRGDRSVVERVSRPGGGRWRCRRRPSR